LNEKQRDQNTKLASKYSLTVQNIYMADRNRPGRSSRDRSYERRWRLNNEKKFNEGDNNTYVIDMF